MNMIDRAQTIATALHSRQVRPFTGEAYIGHPARVVGILLQYAPEASSGMIAAAWLHDAIEDTPATYESINDAFGDYVATLVVELTKPNEPRTVAAKVIKACDLIDNVGTIADVAPQAQARAYLAKKAPQVLRICESLTLACPTLAEALSQAWWRNWDATS